jgi:3-hydroxypropanoate dehydrogenase
MKSQMRNQSEPRNLAAVKTPISQEALDQLFREARTHSAWLPEPVPVELLREAYELARLGPTSANGSPARFVFLITSRRKYKGS